MSQVQCPKCQSRFTVTPRVSGRKVKCNCGSTLQMPQLKKQLVGAAASSPGTTPSSGTSQLSPIRFQCPNCATKLQVGGEMAGRATKCNCGQKFRIPTPATAPTQPAASPTSQPASPFGNEQAAGDPFANSPSDPFANDPFANPGLMSAASPAIDPLTGQPVGQHVGQPVGLPNVARKPRKNTGGSRRDQIKRKSKKSEDTSVAMNTIGGGIFMMAGAVVWLVAGLFADYIFFYPPVLFIIGLVTMIKGFISISN